MNHRTLFFTSGDGISVIGQAAIDFMLPHATYRLEGGHLKVIVSGDTFRLAIEEPVGSGKTRSFIPYDLLRLAADIRVGGGAANSAIAIKLASSDTDVRYLDTSVGEDTVRRRMAYRRFEPRFLGLRETPLSVVLGVNSEKLIVRSAVKPAGKFPECFWADLAWAARGVVLANSVKDTPVMEALIASAKTGLSELIAVLTNSLPGEFVKERVLPFCAAVIVSYDEFHQISGFEIPKNIDGGRLAASWVRQFSPSALVFITMGPSGVLVVDREGLATHVALRQPSPWKEVQGTAALRATMLAGVGDCFAGGVVNALSNGVACVPAAVLASVLAVRWMGHPVPVSADDFVCERVGNVESVAPVGSPLRVRGVLVATTDFEFSCSR